MTTLPSDDGTPASRAAIPPSRWQGWVITAALVELLLPFGILAAVNETAGRVMSFLFDAFDILTITCAVLSGALWFYGKLIGRRIAGWGGRVMGDEPSQLYSGAPGLRAIDRLVHRQRHACEGAVAGAAIPAHVLVVTAINRRGQRPKPFVWPCPMS